VEPTGDLVYVRRDGPWYRGGSVAVAAGLEVVEDEPPLEIGAVLAVGPGRWVPATKGSHTLVRVPIDVKAGDRVLFSRYAGTDDGEDFVLLHANTVGDEHECEIVAVVMYA
jgi:co-chaperonin GroES (HSP10)